MELLARPSDLGAWMHQAGLLDRPPSVGTAQFQEARRLREAIARSALATARGERLPPTDVDQINRGARYPVVPSSIRTPGRSSSMPPGRWRGPSGGSPGTPWASWEVRNARGSRCAPARGAGPCSWTGPGPVPGGGAPWPPAATGPRWPPTGGRPPPVPGPGEPPQPPPTGSPAGPGPGGPKNRTVARGRRTPLIQDGTGSKNKGWNCMSRTASTARIR